MTGGAGGIPKATALALAKAGADVAVVDIADEFTAQTVEEIQALGRRAIGLHADVRRRDDIEDMIEQTRQRLGPIAVAVNGVGSLGAAVPKSFLDFTVEDWNGPVELNLTSTMLCVQAEALAMIRDGMAGSIVTFGSTSGLVAAPSVAHYGAANAGVIHLTKSVALELAPYDIRINCVVPGTHNINRAGRETPTSSRPEQAEFLRKAAAATPQKHLGLAEETAGVALFLASKLSAYMTGHAVISDGGITHTTARPAVGTLEPAALRGLEVSRD
ncbi:SDR family NAD(P)-dependent oxidoreductase [Nocardia cerradoensis]|uniref:SDR family NAD(P)-dependent oxidoreductase n=1 Tax=Nocardia cerradoensis TaxID=85688 RepID=UPI0012F6A0F2|nr:SDR family oxidoreductase [Nocardia cerradoensis]